jgi:LmbE family N-acetylglucosaminyl deacetylase
MFGEAQTFHPSSVLAIGAHPDDVVISIGGVLVQLRNAGYRVVILTLTSGEMGGNPAHRENEEHDAARRLGAIVEFGRLPDGGMALRPTIEIIDQHIARYQPGIVFVHSREDTHQDHVIASAAANISCREVPTLLNYESPSSQFFQPSTVIDVTNVWEQKLYAVEAHVSQIASRSLMTWIDAVARYRAWPRHVGGFCEGLRVCHAEALPTFSVSPLSRQLSRADAHAG